MVCFFFFSWGIKPQKNGYGEGEGGWDNGKKMGDDLYVYKTRKSKKSRCLFILFPFYFEKIKIVVWNTFPNRWLSHSPFGIHLMKRQ